MITPNQQIKYSNKQTRKVGGAVEDENQIKLD